MQLDHSLNWICKKSQKIAKKKSRMSYANSTFCLLTWIFLMICTWKLIYQLVQFGWKPFLLGADCRRLVCKVFPQTHHVQIMFLALMTYRKVGSSDTSCLEPYPGFCRLLMKWIFELRYCDLSFFFFSLSFLHALILRTLWYCFCINNSNFIARILNKIN